MKLSEKLRNLRIEKGETQEFVSKKLGIGITTLRNYENDNLNRLPNTYQLKQLKDYYNVPYEYLLDDSCNNITNDNIEIGKEINLSDKAIETIKQAKCNSDYLNYFIENINLDIFLKSLNQWNILNDIIDYDLFRLIYICDLTEYIKDRMNNGKEDDLIEYFDKCDSSIEKLQNFTSTSENTLHFSPFNSMYESFIDSYINIKEIIFSKKYSKKNYKKKYEDFSNALEDFIDLHDEVFSTMIKLRKLTNFEINQYIDSFLRINEITEIGLGSKHYKQILGKYINYINSNLEVEVKYGNTRTNKK